MAMMILRSDNPVFSYIIEKNPESGMMVREIRKGRAFGWYGDEKSYVIYFKDAENDVSYKKERDGEFEYLDLTRYNSPIFVLNALDAFLGGTLTKRSEHDVEGYVHEIEIPMIELRNKDLFEKLVNYLEGYEMELTHLIGVNYKLTIRTERSLFELINVMNVLSLFLIVYSKTYMHVEESLITKAIKSMNVIDFPYFVRYIFKNHVIKSQDQFNKVKEYLEGSKKDEIEFLYGNTHEQRREFVRSKLRFNKSIVDIGCGEGFYVIPFAKKLAGKYDVHAIDIDENILKEVEKKIRKMKLTNVTLHNGLEEYLLEKEDGKVDVLLVEVIEHMDKDTAKELVRKVLDELDIDKMIITTPNKEFNMYYDLEDKGVRHLDHKWEMTGDEFKEFIGEVIEGRTDVSVEFYNVGDKVNGVSPTQAVVIQKVE